MPLIPLLDVNVLVALAWPNHIHHDRAHQWFTDARGQGWATCPLTQSGFVRVSSNRKAIPDAVAPQESIALLQRIILLPHHQFWHDQFSIADAETVDRGKLFGYRQVTDAHLLGIALANGGCLATFDRGIETIVPQGVSIEEAVVVIP